MTTRMLGSARITTLAFLLALCTTAGAGTPNSQGKSCGQPGAASCPPPVPVASPFAYAADPHYSSSAPNATFHSFADIDAWFTGPWTTNGGWCSATQLSNVEGPNEWGAVPGYQWGILIKDSYEMTYHVIAYTPIAQPGPPWCAQQWQTPVDVLLTRTVSCPPPGTVNYQSSPLLGPTCDPPSKGAGPSCSVGCGNSSSSGGADSGSSQSTFGNPVNVSNGNKFEIETDYVGAGQNPLKFTRTYNSLPQYLAWGYGYSSLSPPPLLGAGWSATYFQFLTFATVTDSTTTYTTVWAYRPDGRLIAFNLYNGV